MVVSAVLAVLGEAVIWCIYGAKRSLYEGILTKIAEVLTLSNKYTDFGLGILKYDAILYYLSVIFIFVFLTIQMIRKKRFN